MLWQLQRFVLFLFVALFSAAAPTSAQGQLIGLWHCQLDCPGGPLRFGLDIAQQGSKLHAHIVNGTERIALPSMEIHDGEIVFDIGHYDSAITCKLKDGKLTGQWKKRRGPDRWVEMKFAGEREKSNTTSAPDEQFDGRWAVTFAKSKDPAVAVFKTQKDGTLMGTFLTTTGDYRYLAGQAMEGKLKLSCFDGAHAFLFDAQISQDGKLSGNFWSSDTWHETWTAIRDEQAKLPDAFQQTTLKQRDSLRSVSFPDLKGRLRTFDDPEFAGKARLIYVFGSWCPNCHDAAAYFSELKQKYGQRGLSILGLAFELTGDFDRDARQVRRYLERHKSDYPVLIAGLSDKAHASKQLPFLDKVRSYPTTIFLDADGNVRAIHTGFTGPATGREYDEMTAKFEKLIEDMLTQ